MFQYFNVSYVRMMRLLAVGACRFDGAARLGGIAGRVQLLRSRSRTGGDAAARRPRTARQRSRGR